MHAKAKSLLHSLQSVLLSEFDIANKQIELP